MDDKLRSITKSLTYRLIALVVLLVITFYATNDLLQTSFISIAFQIVQLFTYYIHERIWEKIKWGKKPNTCESTIN